MTLLCRTIKALIITVLLISFNSPANAQCAKERWSVKKIIDKDTSNIDFNKVTETTDLKNTFE